MYKSTAVLTAAALTLALNPALAQTEDPDIHAEIIEWVFEPCMEVAAALAVNLRHAEAVLPPREE